MRILLVTQYFYPENFRINDIAKGLAEQGHEVEVLTGLPNIPDGKFFKGYSYFKRGEKAHNGVRIHRVGVIPRKKNVLGYILNCGSFYFAAHFKAFFMALLGKKFDAVLCFQISPITAAPPALWFKRFQKANTCIYVQDIWPESLAVILNKRLKGILHHMIALYCARVYRAFDKCIVTAENMQRVLLDKGVEKARLFTVSQWPEMDFLMPRDDALASTLGISKQDFVVCYCGNIGFATGMEQLCLAARLTRDVPHLKFLMVGSGSAMNDLQKNISEMNMADRFVLVGMKKIEEIPNYLSLADVCVAMVSKFGLVDSANIPIPAKVQTYMSAGKPLLTSLGESIGNIWSRYNIGLNAGLDDAEDFSIKLREMVHMEKQQREMMGKNAKDYGDEHFGRETQLKKLQTILQK